MKKTGDVVKRSGLYRSCSMNAIRRINRASEAKLDAWGSVLIVGLSLGVVSLMRMLLAWAQ